MTYSRVKNKASLIDVLTRSIKKIIIILEANSDWLISQLWIEHMTVIGL